MRRIIFATGNEGKMKEIRAILADLGVPVLSMKEAGAPGGIPPLRIRLPTAPTVLDSVPAFRFTN